MNNDSPKHERKNSKSSFCISTESNLINESKIQKKKKESLIKRKEKDIKFLNKKKKPNEEIKDKKHSKEKIKKQKNKIKKIKKTNTNNSNNTPRNNINENINNQEINQNTISNYFQIAFDNFFFDNYFSDDFDRPIFSIFSNNFSSNYEPSLIIPIDLTLIYNEESNNNNNPTSSSIMKKLKKFQMNNKYYKKNSNGEFELPNCCICISEIKKKEKTVLLPCGHIYHWKCCSIWLKNNNTCPVCRFKLTEIN